LLNYRINHAQSISADDQVSPWPAITADAMSNQAEALTEDLMVVNAVKDFKRAYRGLDAKVIPEAWLNSIDSNCKDQLFPRLIGLREGAPISAISLYCQ
jgi:hypothetical protein